MANNSNTFDDSSITETDDWLKDYSDTGQDDGNRAFGKARTHGATDFPADTPSTMAGQYRFIDHSVIVHTTKRNGQHKGVPCRTSVVLYWEHSETGEIVPDWYNAVPGRYKAGKHGQFRTLPPGNKLRKFVCETIGAPKQWCKCHERLHRLKKLEFTGVAVREKDGWRMKEIALKSHLNRTENVGGKSSGTENAGTENVGGKSSGTENTGAKNVRNTLLDIEKPGTASANEKCDEEVRVKSAGKKCEGKVREIPPYNQLTKKNNNTLSIREGVSATTAAPQPDPFCTHCDGAGCAHCFASTDPQPDSADEPWTIDL